MSRANVLYALPCLLLSAACSGSTETPLLAASPTAEPPATARATESSATSASTPASPTPSNNERVEVDQFVGAPPGVSGEEPTAAGGGGAPEGSPGCGQAAALANGEQTLSVGGTERTFLLDVPGEYDPSLAYPLVFGFHGASTSGAQFRSARYGNLLSAMADAAIVVHPTALGNPTSWNTQVDVPFFDAMLELLEQSLCVDVDRVFATGHSSGGFFSNTLGCQRGDVLRAIAPVSGGGPFVFGGAGCTGEVAVWLAHGENDQTVPFASGEASRNGWLGRSGCDDTTTAVLNPAECVDYAGCNAGLPVRWCVHQDGHRWADFAPQGMWDFFRSL